MLTSFQPSIWIEWKGQTIEHRASCFRCEGPINSTSISYAKLVMVRAYFGGEPLVKTDNAAKRETKRVHANLSVFCERGVHFCGFCQPHHDARTRQFWEEKLQMQWVVFMLFLRCFGFCIYKWLLRGGKNISFLRCHLNT